MFSKYILNSTIAGSSELDFNEPNDYEGYVFEIYNTMSSLLFVIFGLYGFINNYYIKNIRNNIRKQVLHMIMIFVGIFSAAFHACVSEFTHVLDIISISVILSTSVYIIRMASADDNTDEYFMIGFRYAIELS